MLAPAVSAGLSAVDGSPQVVIAVHQPLLAGALAHVLRLPETVGDPAVLDSPGRSISLVLWTLQDVTDLVRDLLARP